jgi:hypothetical protein
MSPSPWAFPTGDWCPKGRRAEDGIIPHMYSPTSPLSSPLLDKTIAGRCALSSHCVGSRTQAAVQFTAAHYDRCLCACRASQIESEVRQSLGSGRTLLQHLVDDAGGRSPGYGRAMPGSPSDNELSASRARKPPKP